MTVNERVRYFRKDILHMSQVDFARSIGMKQTGVSYMEQESSTVTDQAIKTISSVHGIREEWLRTGEEPMYKEPATFNLDEFAKERGASDLDLKVVKAYFDLDPQIRKMLIEHFKAELASEDEQPVSSTRESFSKKVRRESKECPDTLDAFEKVYPSVKPADDDETKTG